MKFDSTRKTFIVEDADAIESWWAGDPRVEPYMTRVRERIVKHVTDKYAITDIYNRAYEAVYKAIKDHESKPKMIGEK